MDNLNQRIAGLSPAQRALLELRLKQSGAARLGHKIQPREHPDWARASFAQERLWFLHHLELNPTSYNVPRAIRLQGPLDVQALWRSLDEVVNRHEPYRTRFAIVDGVLRQIIGSHELIPRELIDLTRISGEQRMAEAERLIAAEAVRPFDLANGPVIRAGILKLDDGDHILWLITHHIVSDAWSTAILLRELSELYNAFAAGRPSTLSSPSIQYADFSEWQRESQQGTALEGQLAYWKQQLEGAPSVLNLPTDRQRPAVQTFRGEYKSVQLSDELAQEVRDFSRREGVTVFMTLLAVFQTLLSRYSGMDDVVVGSPIAGRNRTEIEDLIGFFINTLVLRTKLEGNPTFREGLARVKEVTLGAYAHQDLSFERLVDELRPDRELGRNPLFQVFFQFQSRPQTGLNLKDLAASFLDVSTRTSKFDLSLVALERDDGLELTFEYSVDLFDESTVAQMLDHYVVLLTQVVEHPDLHLSELSILTGAERQQLLFEWNRSEDGLPAQQCMHQFFEAQAASNPQRCALIFGSERLTYAQLNDRAAALSTYLRNLGARPETLVAICVERSIEMLVGMLAILKSGAAYVALDPKYPRERVEFMLQDSKAHLLLTQSKLLSDLPETTVKTICLDQSLPQGELTTDQLVVCGTPDNLAYVIYTSGSTGKPKGVAIEHRSAVALINWARKVYSDEELSGVLASTSICFDLSVFELFVPLSFGGTVILANDALQLPTLPHADSVRLVNTVPSAIVQLLRSEGIPRSVCTVNLAGEPLQTTVVQKLYETGTVRRVYDLYGPSEDTTYSTFTLRESDCPATIGFPVENSQAYLLDRQMRLVPPGFPGEVYLGGRGLARGYLDRPDLTGERFVPNPFGPPGSRLYRTGDLARHLTDGRLQYLGRLDNQIKLRGFRIELGEIESTLLARSEISETVALVREDQPGIKRLVAYVVAAAGQEINVPELRGYLGEKLPEYMVPAVIVSLTALPMTPNGKIDRAALPPPASAGPVTTAAPQTSAETELLSIWREVLGLDRIGIDDNFFELGGDSILSIQVIAKANGAGLSITARQIFQRQTIRELAAVASLADRVEAEQGIVTGTVPLTPIQHWFFEQQLADLDHFNQAMSLDAPADLSLELLAEALRHLLRHHDALRMRFVESETGWQQTNGEPSESVPLSQLDLSQLTEGEQDRAIACATSQLQASLNVANGPLLRMLALDLGKRGRRLFIVIHHLAIDVVSWRILLEDLETAYRQLRGGETVKLPRKTTSFKQWGEQLQAYAQSQPVDDERDYWQSVSGPSGSLPADYTGENTEASAETITVRLSAEDTKALLQDLPAVYNTQINDVLLTALLQAVAQRGNGSQLYVNLEGHGREEIISGVDLSRTIGWFTTMFPVLLELKNDRSPAAVLASVKDRLQQIPNRGIGYGLLRYLANKDVASTLSNNPQPEISFNYLGQLDRIHSNSSLFSTAPGDSGPVHSPRQTRAHLLDINGAVSRGQLRMSWTYSRNVHRHETIEALAKGFVSALLSLIRSCSSVSVGTQTRFAGVDQETLTKLPLSGVEDVYPLSPVQQGMLFHAQYAPESDVYRIQSIFTLTGDLDVAVFRRACEEIINRHGVLRTFFVWENLKEPLQLVKKNVEVPLNELDWSRLPEDESAERFAHWLRTDRMEPMSLTTTPLIKLTLIRESPGQYKFVFKSHHILMDGWSAAQVFGELFETYESLRSGADIQVKPVRPYRDYVHWLQQQDLVEAEEYWRKALGGVSAPTTIGGVSPDSIADTSDDFAEQSLQLSLRETELLQQFARANKLTLNTFTQGAWALLLSHYSGSRNVVFGATTAGRPAELAGSQSMTGLFINTLPVHVSISSQDIVLPWLKRLQSDQAEQRQYEFTPLVAIQEWSEIPRGVPLFVCTFVFQNYPGRAAGNFRQSLQIEQRRALERTNYPLSMTVVPHQQLLLRASYDHVHLPDDRIAEMLNHFRRLLLALANGPEQRLASLRVWTDAEEKEIATALNNTVRDYPRDKCLHELFEVQVERTPDAVAVAFGKQQVTYSELNKRANRLARYLRAAGVASETRVAISVQRSPEMIVAILGVLKSGGAYLPVDPDYPADRIAFVLNDAGAAVILTQSRFVERFPKNANAKPICLDSDWSTIARERDDDLQNIATPANLAYVIYTSDTTGNPKGVMVQHTGLINYVDWSANAYRVAEGQGSLVHSSISFDLTVTSLFAPLLAGRRLVLLPEESGPEALATALCESEGPALVKITPAHLQVLKQLVPADAASAALNTVVIGGEALHGEELAFWRDQAPQIRIVNEYGPTETVVGSTAYEFLAGSVVPGPVPIGAPVANTKIYLLDEQHRLVPRGAPGEICIAGDGVARGYLNRPELTAESFIPDPFSSVPGVRMYKSGDWARLLPNGALEFVGRVDHQIKLRGFRIELGEIESVLKQHEAVKQAVVIIREDEPSERRLVSYVELQADADIGSGDLRQYLRGKLPDYMVPAAFVILDSIPNTAAGEVDRAVLPAPLRADHQDETDYVAPRSLTEETLSDIWRNVLRLERIGINDNFFELGGHSLLAMQAVSRIRQSFQIDIALRTLFDKPTIAALSVEIEKLSRVSDPAGPIVPVPRTGPLPLSFGQRRLWFSNEYEIGNAFFNTRWGAFLDGQLNVVALVAAIKSLIQRHETLRTIIKVIDGETVQIVKPEVDLDLTFVDLSSCSLNRFENEALRIVDEEGKRAFNLSSNTPFRARLLRFDDDRHALVLTLHHIASDGWSVGVLLRDLSAFYESHVSGLPASLPDLPVQYADYAVWQRQTLTSQALEEQLAYWTRRLGNSAPLLELPADRPRPAVLSRRGARHAFAFSEELSRQLNTLSQQHGVTLFMTLLAAFQLLLSHYSKRDDIVVGTDVANRDRVELEGIVGFFINNVVLRTDLANDPTFADLLERVREVALEAYAHQAVPFEKVVEAVNPKRSASYSPLFQVLFTFQNTPANGWLFPGLTLRNLGVETITTKYDLTLFMSETEKGLRATLEYNTDLFDAATVAGIASDFTTLLNAAVSHSLANLNELKEKIAEHQEHRQMIEKKERAESNLKRFKSIRPKSVVVAPRQLIRTSQLQPDNGLPLVIQPEVAGVDLAEWASGNLEFIESSLAKHGALLFRGFGIHDANGFERFASAIRQDLFNENGEHPREVVSGKVYTPVFYSPDKQLLWHNENSFNYRWPVKIWFCCLKPAAEGGETPIVDSRKVYEHLDPNLREEFERKQVMYVRNHWEGLGLSWQTLFQTNDRSAVEAYCRQMSIDFDWKGEDGFTTRQVRPAVIRHPRTGERSWFNQIQHWHIACLEPAVRESITSQFSEADLPRHAYFGDGSPIEDSVMAEILDVYRQLEVKFPWQASDIMMVDNILTAHGRNPFVGERKLLVSMAEMLSYDDV